MWQALLLVVVTSGVCRAGESATTCKQFSRWGGETLQMIRRELWMEGDKLYADRADVGKGPLHPAFMWGAGVQLSALAMAARVDESRYLPQLTDCADALDVYWIEHNGVGGYDVLPRQPNSDRYYDDNAWIVLAMLETHALTNDARYLDRAQATMKFVLSGEDDRLGGGIYWRENTRDSKNTCSNAPAIVGCLLLYRATKDGEYLANAERLFAWSQTHLQDRDDGLYWDNLRLDGRIDRRKFTYNTALAIRANCLLYEATNNADYLNEAKRLATAAAARWIDKETGAVKDAGRFAHMLLEALLAVDRTTGEPHWREVVDKSVTYVHAHLRDGRGHYGGRWDRPPAEPWPRSELLDQASAARAFFAAASTDANSNAEESSRPPHRNPK
ncbi:MAG: glycoside hydrolase family 76 protein [Pirellulales bacterium]